LAILRPWEGVCGGLKIFGSALLRPARNVCVSLSAFFNLKCNCFRAYHLRINGLTLLSATNSQRQTEGIGVYSVVIIVFFAEILFIALALTVH